MDKTKEEKFQKTGNNIPVTELELIEFMGTKYTEYYNDNTLPNPEKDDIIYKTREGKVIMVPDEIKIKAKTLWLKLLMDESFNNEIKENYEDIKEEKTNWWNILIYAVVIIIVLYLLYLLVKMY